MVALPPSCAGPLVCFGLFAAARPAKLGYHWDMPLTRVGLALAPPVRMEGEVLRGGDLAADRCSWGAAGTRTSPRPDPLADALRAPTLPVSSDCPAAAGLFQRRLQ